MTSRHAVRTPRPIALAVAGTGLAGVLALTGGGADFLAQVAAKTIIVVGGASDPTGKDQWARIGRDYSGPPPVFVQYPAVFGVGFPGLALSSDFQHTYAQSNDIGAAATVDAITAAKADPDEEVVIYTISQGSDVVSLAVLRYGQDNPRPSDGSAKLTVIEQGSPSYIRSGVWNVIPAGIPGLHNGPVRNNGASGATVVSVCVKGDYGCGMGVNPLIAAFYLPPGFLMHGAVYTAENIGRYSPTDGEPFTPGSTPEAPVSTRTETRNGNTVTVDTYANGTVKRTWTEDNTTWVSIDTGENPWGWMLRRNGIDVPKEFDQVLNTLVPVPEPGDSGLVPRLPVAPSFDPSPALARHGTDRPDAVTVAQLAAREERQTAQPPAVRDDPLPQEPTVPEPAPTATPAPAGPAAPAAAEPEAAEPASQALTVPSERIEPEQAPATGGPAAAEAAEAAEAPAPAA
ncbi:PE-PPE domain-containing protein [Tsukamurella asaccharolytica]|uniref:PE-PPE domain-containing protein n=1 Tax=Tsukamurella asaccharolytica TaxID=2592067 RepID=A0A5C5R9K3_9ACTN|nr:PE-PPE domain-containing protein [Tsukamurella asaccharolytica]TWS19827.1 PE-PPE domain-containing protein [Tsukamurella asaccharolytica]